MAGQRVGAAGGVEEHRRLAAAAARRVQEGVAGAIGELARLEVVPLGGTHPALLGDHHGDRLGGHQLLLGQRPRRLAPHDRRAAVVTVLDGVGLELLAHLPRQPLLRLEDPLELVALAHQGVLFAADLHLLEPRQVAQLELEDRLRLRLGEGEARHQHRPGVLLAADDGDHLVDVEEGDEEPLEDVQARQHAVVAVLQPAHRLGAEAQPLDSMVRRVYRPRPAVEPRCRSC